MRDAADRTLPTFLSREPPLEVLLVLGIARLGERDLRGWWRSEGISKTGRWILQGVFPRTSLASGLELDVLAAAYRQEQMIGRPAAHLFSDHLPFCRHALAWLAECKANGSSDLLDLLADWDLDRASRDLRWWTQGASVAGEVLGEGLQLEAPSGDAMREGEGARRLAAAYLDQGTRLYAPYFELPA